MGGAGIGCAVYARFLAQPGWGDAHPPADGVGPLARSWPYQGGATRTPEFLALNPNGHIPVLVDERPESRVVVWESKACALYRARHHGRGDGTDIAPVMPPEAPRPCAGRFGP
ncbi:hypothetical protein [Tepidimonas sp.]|uniref:hypothetical protein n=1 Tax=Tepidimonas sp. TaxID=2002775 RepID=UPI002FE0A909